MILLVGEWGNRTFIKAKIGICPSLMSKICSSLKKKTDLLLLERIEGIVARMSMQKVDLR